MNYIDILICIPVIWGIYKGVTDGIITQVAGIAAFFGGVWLAFNFYEEFTRLFSFADKYAPVISFSVIFLLSVLLVFLAAKLVNKIVDNASLSTANKMAGAVFGALKFALILSVIFFMVDAIESSYPALSFKQKKESLLYQPIAKIAPTIVPGLKNQKIEFGNKNNNEIKLSYLPKNNQAGE
ncbi:MAG: CvpA family protein [Bacteroidota bacterium]|jgi:membrane protein required for colicin V production